MQVLNLSRLFPLQPQRNVARKRPLRGGGRAGGSAPPAEPVAARTMGLCLCDTESLSQMHQLPVQAREGFLEDASLLIPLARGRRGPGGLQHCRARRGCRSVCLNPVLPAFLPQAARAILNIAPVSRTLNYGNFQINSVSGAVWRVTDRRWVNLFPADVVWMVLWGNLRLKAAGERGLGEHGGGRRLIFSLAAEAGGSFLQLSASHRGSSPRSRAPCGAGPSRGQSCPAKTLPG